MSPLDAYHLALDLVKKAGFTLHQASMNSETCYYTRPSRVPLLLRVSMHPSKRSPIGMRGKTIARITISPKTDTVDPEIHTRNLVAIGIGRYFINDPKPSEYHGKKGTWEAAQVRGAR